MENNENDEYGISKKELERREKIAREYGVIIS